MYQEGCSCLTSSDITNPNLKNFISCNISDFAMSLGASCINRNNPDKRNGQYIIITNQMHQPAVFNCESNKIIWDNPENNSICFRPVINYNDVASKCIIRNQLSDDLIIVEYGEYPQRIVGGREVSDLDVTQRLNYLEKTGKKYTINANSFNQKDTSFSPKELDEYVINNEKYVFIEKEFNKIIPFVNLNGDIQNPNERIWVRVLPIKWLVDLKTGKMICLDAILSGIRFNSYNNKIVCNYENSEIRFFADNYFFNEIKPSELLNSSFRKM